MSLSKEDVVTVSRQICEQYRRDYSITPTLRQLYYQFVAEGSTA